MSIKLLLLFIFTVLIASCGGSDSLSRIKGTGGGSSAVATTINSIGTLTNARALSVNGTTYDTSLAEVIIDNNAGVLSDLQLGQVVVIDGDVSLGQEQVIAQRIRFDTSIQGSITEISDNVIVILDQEIILYDNAYFVGVGLQSIDDLANNDVLKLSGYPLSDGRFVATYIERLSEPAVLSIVTGYVAGLDDSKQQFSINKLLINYSQLAMPQVLSNGQSIKVSGEIVSNNGAQQLNANSIELIRPNTAAAATFSETQGFVTRFFSPAEFEIDGTMISASNETEYIGGEKSDLEQDIMLEVEGVVDAEGVVNATKIIFWLPP